MASKKVHGIWGSYRMGEDGHVKCYSVKSRAISQRESEDPKDVAFRLEHDWVIGSIVKVSQSLPLVPEVIWTVGSSGTLNRGLQLAFPESEVHVIQTGHKLDERQIGRAIFHKSPYKFDQPVKAEEAPPFPSAPEYDAKAWKSNTGKYGQE